MKVQTSTIWEEDHLEGWIHFSNCVGSLGMRTTEVFSSTGIFHFRKEKKCNAQLPPPSHPDSLVPFQDRAPRCCLLSPPPGGGLPRPRGPDGTAGRDAADPALSHPTFRLPGLVLVAAPRPDEAGITPL